MLGFAISGLLYYPDLPEMWKQRCSGRHIAPAASVYSDSLKGFDSVPKTVLRLIIVLLLLLPGCRQDGRHSASDAGSAGFSREKVLPGTPPTITIRFDQNGVTKRKAVTVRDRNIADRLLKMMNESTREITPANLARIREVNVDGGEITIEEKPGDKRTVRFVYDSLYEIGYISADSRRMDPGSDFFRYLFSLSASRPLSSDADPAVRTLFASWKWTVSHRIRSFNVVLPPDTMHDAGENAVKLYWAWSNDLSKDVGLDFSSVFGKKAAVEIYSLIEPLPEKMKPYRDAQGIIIRSGEKIVGAYIDGGFGLMSCCSLKRAMHEKVTAADWDGWVDRHINYNNPLEKDTAPLKPEEVVRRYFECLKNRRLREAFALRTRSYMADLLFINKRRDLLYLEKLDSFETCIKKVTLRSVETVPPDPTLKGAVLFSTLADYRWSGEVYVRDGGHCYYFQLRSETPRSGWKIQSIGTGL